MDTASIDNAAVALETRGFYIRKAGSDGFRFGFKPTLKKVVSDRRASLDDEEIVRETRKLIKSEFEKSATVPVECFPEDATAVDDSPRLTLWVLDPSHEWRDDGALRSELADWTRMRGKSARLYPASLIWTVRKPGRELRDKIEQWLAWRRVEQDIRSHVLEGDFERSEIAEIAGKIRDAESDARDEVWAAYRYVLFADSAGEHGMRVIDLGAGHASGANSLSGRIVAALKQNALLNDSPGASYLERRWPQAFKESGAWPLKSLRQAFLDGSLDRLLNPDEYLRRRIPEFVQRSEFGLAAGGDPAAGYSRIWFSETLPPEEVAFDPDVYLLTKQKAAALKAKPEAFPPGAPLEGTRATPDLTNQVAPQTEPSTTPTATADAKTRIRIAGPVPPEVWNRIGTKLIPKLRSGTALQIGVDFTVELAANDTAHFLQELKQVLADLNLTPALKIEPNR